MDEKYNEHASDEEIAKTIDEYFLDAREALKHKANYLMVLVGYHSHGENEDHTDAAHEQETCLAGHACALEMALAQAMHHDPTVAHIVANAMMKLIVLEAHEKDWSDE